MRVGSGLHEEMDAGDGMNMYMNGNMDTMVGNVEQRIIVW